MQSLLLASGILIGINLITIHLFIYIFICVVCVRVCACVVVGVGGVDRGGAWWRRRGCSVSDVNADGAAEDGAEAVLFHIAVSHLWNFPSHYLGFPFNLHPDCGFFFFSPFPVNFAADICAPVHFTHLSFNATPGFVCLVSGRNENLVKKASAKNTFSARLQPDTPSAGLSCHCYNQYGWRQSR